jgi:hypothetical protein
MFLSLVGELMGYSKKKNFVSDALQKFCPQNKKRLFEKTRTTVIGTALKTSRAIGRFQYFALL